MSSVSISSFPTFICITPEASHVKVCLPFLYSSTTLATSSVTVPILGFGINPLGPNSLPKIAISDITEGVAIATSNSIFPAFTSFTNLSKSKKSAPAFLASSCLSFVNTAIFTFALPSECGRERLPLIDLGSLSLGILISACSSKEPTNLE